MDTNEECERFNRSTEPQILPLAAYWYTYAEQGLNLEKKSSFWNKKEEEELQRCKRRKVGDGKDKFTNTSFITYLEHDTLLKMLSLLDFETLIRCMVVERSLRNMIRSPQLRRLWSENQPPVMLLSSVTLPCVLWVNRGNPDSSTAVEFQPLSKGLNLPRGDMNPLVVASHRGLVCLRFSYEYRIPDELDLVIGNPLTGDWVALPTTSKAFRAGFRDDGDGGYSYRYTLEVIGDDHTGNPTLLDFKVAAFYTSTERHCWNVFDSVTGEWSNTSLYFPPRTAFKWSAFNLRSILWRTELIRKWEIKTGLERSPTEVHRLPHPNLHGFCQWEYNGSTFFASAWTVLQPKYGPKEDSFGEFAGYGVWKVADNGQRLETVAVVWGEEVGVSLRAVRENVWYRCQIVDCSVSRNLVWFYGESKYSPSMPVVVYDIETGKWSVFDEQHETADENSPVDHYAAAVLYTPSLFVAPSRPKSRSLTSKEEQKEGPPRMRRCACSTARTVTTEDSAASTCTPLS